MELDSLTKYNYELNDQIEDLVQRLEVAEISSQNQIEKLKKDFIDCSEELTQCSKELTVYDEISRKRKAVSSSNIQFENRQLNIERYEKLVSEYLLKRRTRELSAKTRLPVPQQYLTLEDTKEIQRRVDELLSLTYFADKKQIQNLNNLFDRSPDLETLNSRVRYNDLMKNLRGVRDQYKK
jgi:hypothetical protein